MSHCIQVLTYTTWGSTPTLSHSQAHFPLQAFHFKNFTCLCDSYEIRVKVN